MKNLSLPSIVVIFLVSIAPTVLFPMITKSQTDCNATSKKFQYNCNVLFLQKKELMRGYSGFVGAKMPSMAMAHNVKPVKFSEKEDMTGHYEFTIQLEMLGEWMFQYDISIPTRDRVMEKLIFDKTKSTASDKKHNHSHHKHSDHKHSGHDH
tara:strand:- start:166 stop:621 length:456 start_codon:yes stop_codon:yes gene_type:complete